MTTFAEWFPLPVGSDTLLMLAVTVVLVMAGTIVGIIVKELEIYNPNNNPKRFSLFNDENKMFMLLGLGLSIGFWISSVPAMECFVYSTGIKIGLGTVRNLIDRKRNGGTLLPLNELTRQVEAHRRMSDSG